MKTSEIQLLTQISFYNVRVWIKPLSPQNKRSDKLIINKLERFFFFSVTQNQTHKQFIFKRIRENLIPKVS